MKRIAIVNRGEAAVRFVRALRAVRRETGCTLESVALVTSADADSLLVRVADRTVQLGTSPDAYLDSMTVLDALRRSACDAAWLGWGFASEDAAFVAALERAGVTILGPGSETIAMLGDKVEAKRLAEAHDVPVAPWCCFDSLDEAKEASVNVGFPLVVKASGGGGGRGIRVAHGPADLDSAVGAVERESSKLAERGRLYLEACIERGRHLEVQVFGDGNGAVCAFGLRDCSLQRRRQKIIEESPAPGLDSQITESIVEAALRLTRAVAYRSAGTVEFLYQPESRRFFFLEVNTRLQVEHPVTEMVHGVDLVRMQIQLALGDLTDLEAPAARGWAIEARVCAEDPDRGFAPAPGRLGLLRLPSGPGVRVDTGFEEGDHISPAFDSLIAKIIAWGPSRRSAIARLHHALNDTKLVIEGGCSNLADLIALLESAPVIDGCLDIGLVERLPRARSSSGAVAIVAHAIDALASGDASEGASESRHHRHGLYIFRLARHAYVLRSQHGWLVANRRVRSACEWTLGLGGGQHRIENVSGGSTTVVDGRSYRTNTPVGGVVTAPSPAVVLTLEVDPGQRVSKGQPVAMIEAMKTEIRLVAPCDGTVRSVEVHPGAHVSAGHPLLVLDVEDDDGDTDILAVLPWRNQFGERTAELILKAMLLGWGLIADALDKAAQGVGEGKIPQLLEVFVDFAEFFDRRSRGRADGANAPPLSGRALVETVTHHGLSILSDNQRTGLARVAHHLDFADVDALLTDRSFAERLVRIDAQLDAGVRPIAALVARLSTPLIGVLDRMSSLDPSRFAPIRRAADRARYRLVERPALRAIVSGAQRRAQTWLEKNTGGSAPDWREIHRTPESLVPVLTRAALDGHPLAVEAMARRLLYTGGERIEREQVDGTPLIVITSEDDVSVCGIARAEDAPNVLAKALTIRARRYTLSLLGSTRDPVEIERVLDRLRRLPFVGDVCVLWSAPGFTHPAVRWLDAQGVEVEIRRDIMPTTWRRLAVARFAHFRLSREPCTPEVVVLRATARDDPSDVRLIALGEVRRWAPSPGADAHRPDVERVLHAALRALAAVKDRIDPEDRLQNNRLYLRILPEVELSLDELIAYAHGLVPRFAVGVETVEMRGRLPQIGQGLTDLKIRATIAGQLLHDMGPATDEPLAPLSHEQVHIGRARRRGEAHPRELIDFLGSGSRVPTTEFDALTVDQGGRACARWSPENSAEVASSGVVFGLLTTPTDVGGRAWLRVGIFSDPSAQLGALAEPECRRIIAALDVAESLGVPVEWISVSSGARISLDEGTENLDWTAAVLARIVRFTQGGGEINIIVPGLCVGAQAYWNAEATMLMHTRGLLLMTDRGAMVLTGKRALDISGCVSARDNLELGGYSAVMGPNGQAQGHAPDLPSAYETLYRYYRITYCSPGTSRPARLKTPDPANRDVGETPYPHSWRDGFETVGDICADRANPGRKRPFAIVPVMSALCDADCVPVARWAGWRDAEGAAVWECRIGGYATQLIGVDNITRLRQGSLDGDGPTALAGGTLYPQSARKIARALNAASGRRPAVVLANLSGFDGSPESLRKWQLEYGAELGRAVTNFDGTLVVVVVSRYHGGAYVVFSRRLNPKIEVVAIRGSYASVIGGLPAAKIVLGREVRRRAAAQGSTPEAFSAATAAVAAMYDDVHDVQRATQVGSIDRVITLAELRPFVIERLERDWHRACARDREPTGHPPTRSSAAQDKVVVIRASCPIETPSRASTSSVERTAPDDLQTPSTLPRSQRR